MKKKKKKRGKNKVGHARKPYLQFKKNYKLKYVLRSLTPIHQKHYETEKTNALIIKKKTGHIPGGGTVPVKSQSCSSKKKIEVFSKYKIIYMQGVYVCSVIHNFFFLGRGWPELSVTASTPKIATPNNPPKKKSLKKALFSLQS